MAIHILKSSIYCTAKSLISFASLLLIPWMLSCKNRIEKQNSWKLPTLEYSMVQIPEGNYQDVFCGIAIPNKHKINPFWIGETEVTQKQWKLIMGDFEIHPEKPSPFWGLDPSLPKVSISYHDIETYLDSLNKRTGINFRLPTKVEWEFACLAGSTTSYHFGDNITKKDANYNYVYQTSSSTMVDSLKGPSKVGSYASNSWGLFDMHGNVYEWTSTQQLNSESNESQAISYYIKGGSWAFGPKKAEACSQIGHESKHWGYSIGFRLAADLNEINPNLSSAK